MSDKKPRIGGLSAQREKYGSLGGGRSRQGSDSQVEDQAPERSDVEASGRSDAQTSKRSDAQTPEHSSALTPERLDIQALVTGTQQQKPKRVRQTVYIESEHDRWIRHRIADTREDISDVVNDAIAFYRANAG